MKFVMTGNGMKNKKRWPVTDEDRSTYLKRSTDLAQRFNKGVLNPKAVCQRLQQIIEGKADKISALIQEINDKIGREKRYGEDWGENELSLLTWIRDRLERVFPIGTEIKEICWYCLNPKCRKLLGRRERVGTDRWIRDTCGSCGHEFNVYISTGKSGAIGASTQEWKQAMEEAQTLPQ